MFSPLETGSMGITDCIFKLKCSCPPKMVPLDTCMGQCNTVKWLKKCLHLTEWGGDHSFLAITSSYIKMQYEREKGRKRAGYYHTCQCEVSLSVWNWRLPEPGWALCQVTLVQVSWAIGSRCHQLLGPDIISCQVTAYYRFALVTEWFSLFF